MLYDDARTAPKTAEEHERDAYGSTYLTGEEARRILAAHKVAGRSKLGADEARRMAREQWPDGVGPLLRGDRPEAVAAPFRPPGPLGYRGGLKRNPLFCCHFGTTASDASRVTDMVSLRFTISAPLRCSLPGQPRTPGWLPARIARRGARAGSHTGADTPAGGDRRGHDYGRAFIRRHAVGMGIGEGVRAVHDVAGRLIASPGDLDGAAPIAGGEQAAVHGLGAVAVSDQVRRRAPPEAGAVEPADPAVAHGGMRFAGGYMQTG